MTGRRFLIAAMVLSVACATQREVADNDAVTVRAVAIVSRTYRASGLPSPPIGHLRWEDGVHVAGSDRGGVTIWDGRECDIRVATRPDRELVPWARQERAWREDGSPVGPVSSTAFARELLECVLCAAGECDAGHQRREWGLVWWANQQLAQERL